MNLFSTAYRSFWLTLTSGVTLIFAFPPIGLAWAAWLTPIGALRLIDGPPEHSKINKRQVWMASFLCWLVLFQCVRLPHWAGYLGWPLLSAYLSFYLFLFILVSRHLLHRWKIPLMMVAPVTWVGLEYLQAHLFTGISLAMLSHTQVSFPIIIQVADIAGCYTISFLMVAIAAGAYRIFTGIGKKRLAAAGQVLFCISLLLGYGNYRLDQTDRELKKHPFQIALIQGAIDTRFPATRDEAQAYYQEIYEQYAQLSISSRQSKVDLIVWPESMFPVYDAYSQSDSLTEEQQESLQRSQAQIRMQAQFLSGSRVPTTKDGSNPTIRNPVPMLVGVNSFDLLNENSISNSAVLVNQNGVVTDRYSKMKLVLFGEYVPLGDQFPWLYSAFPMSQGLVAGDTPTAIQVQKFRFAPNICFESTYPHLIRNHVGELVKQDSKPDCLVNLANDGWFWGSNALDYHWANSRLRSVENRTPMIIAANTGFSGSIDSAGRVLAKGPRRDKTVLHVSLMTTDQEAIYHFWGDWPVFLCFLVVLGCFLDWIQSFLIRRNYN